MLVRVGLGLISILICDLLCSRVLKLCLMVCFRGMLWVIVWVRLRWLLVSRVISFG